MIPQARRAAPSASPPTAAADHNTTGSGGALMTRLRAILIGLAGGLIVGQLTVWFGIVAAVGPAVYVRHHTDFLHILTGARVLAEGGGHNLYDIATQRAAQQRVLAPYLTLEGGDLLLLPYNHPPYEALLLVPLARLPYEVQYALWCVLLASAVGASLWLLARAVPMPGAYRPLALLAACAYPPVHGSLWGGQTSPFLLLGLCAAFAALKRGQDGRGAAGLALLSLKPQLLPVVALLVLLGRRWKALAIYSGLLGILVLALVPVLGVGWPLQYLRFVFAVARLGRQTYMDPAEAPSWRGFAVAMTGSASWPATVLYVALALATIGVLLWAWQRSDRPTAADAPRFDLLWALVTVVSVLVAPHGVPADQLLLVVPGWIGVAHIATGRWAGLKARWWLALVGIIYAIYALGWAFPSGTPGVPPRQVWLAAAAVFLAHQAVVSSPRSAASGRLGAPIVAEPLSEVQRPGHD